MASFETNEKQAQAFKHSICQQQLCVPAANGRWRRAVAIKVFVYVRTIRTQFHEEHQIAVPKNQYNETICATSPRCSVGGGK